MRKWGDKGSLIRQRKMTVRQARKLGGEMMKLDSTGTWPYAERRNEQGWFEILERIPKWP